MNLFTEVTMTVTGSRTITDRDFIYKSLSDFITKYNLAPENLILNSGHAIGVDRIAEDWAKVNNVRVMKYIPNWDVGRHAGIIRNEAMVKDSEYVCGIWDGKSRGTKHCIEYAKKKNKVVEVYLYE